MEVPFQYKGVGQTIYTKHGAPDYKTPRSAGFDLRCCTTAPITVAPVSQGVWPVAVPLGIAVALPDGFELQLRPRSGLGGNWGVNLANTPGTIDTDYRGEIEARLVCFGPEPVQIQPGDRVVQAVIAPVETVRLTPAVSLDDTERGTASFESTGRS